LPNRVLAGKPEGKRQFGKLRLRWERSIKMNLQEVGWRGMEWIALAQDRDRWRAVVNAIMNLRVTYSAVNYLTNLGPVAFL
jgi:CRISPR/Cas system-associated protein Cas7 (RAMP superfamily)